MVHFLKKAIHRYFEIASEIYKHEYYHVDY